MAWRSTRRVRALDVTAESAGTMSVLTTGSPPAPLFTVTDLGYNQWHVAVKP
jgi:hypothetical protein